MIKIISLIIVLAFIMGCSSSNIKRVNKKEFLEKAKYIQLQKPATIPQQRAIFIGATKDSIYIQYWKHWSSYPHMKTRKTWIYITPRKLLTIDELIKIDRSLGFLWPSFSNTNTNTNKYIGVWQNENKEIITIEENGNVKPWKNATWDITKNNGIIIMFKMFKSDSDVDIVKAQLNKTGELIIHNGSRSIKYIKKLPTSLNGFNFDKL